MRMKKLVNPYREIPGYRCFGCSPDHPDGLKMEFWLDGGAVVCEWMPGDGFQGYLGVLHGGIQATLLDEIASWWVMVVLGTSGVTSSMDVKYRKPVMIADGPLHLRASLNRMIRNVAVISAELRNREGVLCAEAEIKYFTFREEVARRDFFYPGRENFFGNPEENRHG